jgi:Cupin domain
MPETSNPAVRERTDQPPQTLIIPPDDGDTIHAYGDTALLVKLSGQQTNGSMVVVVGTSPPEGGPPPHRHRNEDEMFIVLEGKIRFLANGMDGTSRARHHRLHPTRGGSYLSKRWGDDLPSMDHCNAERV